MSPEQRQLQAAILALEAQRAVLGDAVVDTALAAARSGMAASTAQEPLAEPAQALKQVSILFLDVVGSTALSQRLDPEATAAVMDDALSRGTAIVKAHGGKVLQYAGDSILAAFGADEIREDDAERAVRCGLALRELGKALGVEVKAAHGHAGIDLRLGIHTGGVLLGGGVDREGGIRGTAVNVAARMEQTAPAGALRISHDTYVQVRGRFDVEAQEPIVVKGVDTPLRSYLVQRARPRGFRSGTRGIEGVATKMIGRDAELGQLQGAFKRVFETRELAAVTVVADAGIGKSRLLYEFEGWSESQPETFLLFRGRATPQTGLQAYGLLRDILARRFRIHDDDSVEAARRKMEDAIVPLFLHDDGADAAEAHAHLLGHLIGIDWQDSRHLASILEDGKQIRTRALHAAAQLFRRVGAGDGRPVVLQLEDLHWADDETLDFLDHLGEVNRDVPMLVLAFARPTLFERRPEGSTGSRSTAGTHTRIDLHPLDEAASRLLAGELLQKLPDIPAGLSELLVDRAEGNPFYMEELLRMLIDRSAIRTGETWTVNAERLLVSQVPPTLTGVLQARLDGLPAQEKRALQQASVVGAVFWDLPLSAVEEEAVRHLPALVQRELTLPRPDAVLEGLREYAFRHQVLHQVTYDTVLRRAKREGHAKVARWMAQMTEQGGLRAGDLLGLAAEHFERAGDDVRAAEFHARAAEQAWQRFAHERVLSHVGRALTLLDQAPRAQAAQAATADADVAELRWRLLFVREKTLGLQARRAEQAADLDALAGLADELADDRRRGHAARRRALRAMRVADWAAAEDAARHAMTCAVRVGDDGGRLHAMRLLAWARLRQGDAEGCRALALPGLDEARSLGLRDVESNMLNVLAMAAAQQGDMVGHLHATQQALQIYREMGDRVNESNGLQTLGIAWLNLGDLVQARRDLDAAVLLLRANGNRAVEGVTLCMLAVVALWQGDPMRALALAGASREIAVTAQARDSEVLALLQTGAAELLRGHGAAARQAYAQARQQAMEIGIPLQHEASAGLARVALADGDTAAALAALQPLLDHVAAGGSFSDTEERLIELTCHQALARAGDPRAADWLARAHTALTDAAATITDAALRECFLRNVPYHREILAAWSKGGSLVGPGSRH